MDRTVPRGVIVKSIPPAAVIMKLDDASVNLAGTVSAALVVVRLGFGVRTAKVHAHVGTMELAIVKTARVTACLDGVNQTVTDLAEVDDTARTVVIFVQTAPMMNLVFPSLVHALVWQAVGAPIARTFVLLGRGDVDVAMFVSVKTAASVIL